MHIPCGPCILRPWRDEDLGALVRHANDEAVACQLRDLFPHPYTRPDGEDWLRIIAQSRPEIGLAIEVDGEAAGCIGVKSGYDIERVSGEVGYWLGRAVWGRGIATEAVKGLSGHAFAHLGLTRLFALPFASNLASRRVLEKAGYTFDCILRKSAIKNGQVTDQALYSLIAP